MPSDDFPIKASTKVGELLERYPELEEVLIGIAPPFKKLKNSILRRSVGKVASLRQVAAVGRVPLDELVNKLRVAVGQEAIASENIGSEVSYFESQPDWFDRAKVVTCVDDREASDPDKMSLVTLLQKAAQLKETEIVELVTTFLPAPGIDVMKSKGYLVWSEQEGSELIRTYFSKPTGP